jgi:hypothetical protein
MKLNGIHAFEFNYLKDEYPLSQEWRDIQAFEHSVTVCDVNIVLFGMSATHKSGKEISASSIHDFEHIASGGLAAAYFELLERTALIEASSVPHFPIINYLGEEFGQIDYTRVFPGSPDPRWKYSLSNGISANIGREAACKSANFELIERDLILRSWYDNLKSIKVSNWVEFPTSFNDNYDIQSYSFSNSDQDCSVVGIFGFPKIHIPLIYGFGARATIDEAIAVAKRECIQRLGFLWGESIPSQAPTLKCTAEFHQAFYLYPPHHIKLRNWLDNDLGRMMHVPTCKIENRQFIDLTPDHLKHKMYVVKALLKSEIPLTFGLPRSCNRIYPDRTIHPIA